VVRDGANFIDELDAHIQNVEHAIRNRSGARVAHKDATAGIDAAIKSGMDAGSSSIVLGRAAMEQALKDRLNKGEQGETKLTDLTKEALWTGALDRAHESLASNPADCVWETLSAARGVIKLLVFQIE
jgi:hypothetical protein